MRRTGKRLVAGAVALATAFSLVVGTAFRHPAELLQEDTSPAIVECIAPDVQNDFDEDGGNDTAPEEKKKTLRERIRQLIVSLPFAVRLLVCLPAWGIGWILIALGGAVWSTVLSPVASTIVGVMLTAIVLIALVGFSVKMAAPETPIKKIITRRNISLAIVCAVSGEACFVLLQLFWPEWERYSDLVRNMLTLALILAAALPAVFRKRKSSELSSR